MTSRISLAVNVDTVAAQRQARGVRAPDPVFAALLAEQAGATDVEVFSDSELIVRQLQGRYRVKAPALKPLFAQAKQKIRGFSTFRIIHVRREQNKAADRMVNAALDQAESEPDSAVRLHELLEPTVESR